MICRVILYFYFYNVLQHLQYLTCRQWGQNIIPMETFINHCVLHSGSLKFILQHFCIHFANETKMPISLHCHIFFILLFSDIMAVFAQKRVHFSKHYFLNIKSTCFLPYIYIDDYNLFEMQAALQNLEKIIYLSFPKVYS